MQDISSIHPVQTTQPHPLRNRTLRSRWPFWLVAFAILTLSLGLVLWLQADDYRVLGQHTDFVRSLAFSPDGKTLYSASRHGHQGMGAIKVWDLAIGQEQRSLPAGEAMTLSTDGKLLAAVDHDRQQLNIWNVPAGNKRTMLQGTPTAFWTVAFSPDAKLVATGGGSWHPTHIAELQLWNTDTGKMIRQFKGHTSRVNSVAFSPDGKLLATSSWDKSVRLWDVANGRELAILLGPENNGFTVDHLAFSPDGRYLAVINQGPIVVWEAATRKQVATLRWTGNGPPSCLHFSSDSKLLAMGGQCLRLGYLKSSYAEIWEVDGWRKRSAVQRPGIMLVSLAISPDGIHLATGSFDGKVTLGRLLP